MFSTMGDIMSTGGYLEYSGRYHDALGDIISTVGEGCSVPWGEEILWGRSNIPKKKQIENKNVEQALKRH